MLVVGGQALLGEFGAEFGHARLEGIGGPAVKRGLPLSFLGERQHFGIDRAGVLP